MLKILSRPPTLFILILFVISNSCKKEMDIKPENENGTEIKPTIIIYKDQTRFVDENTNALLETLNDNQLVYSSSNEQLDDIVEGDIIVSTKPSEFLDHGYIYKVLSVSDEGGKKSFEVEPGAIIDYIVYADIYLDYDLVPPSNERYGNSYQGEGFCKDFKIKIDHQEKIDSLEYIEGGCNQAASNPGTLDFYALVETEEICINSQFELHIRPDDHDFSQCLENASKAFDDNDAGFFGFVQDVADFAGQAWDAGGCTAHEIAAKFALSRIDGGGMSFTLDAPKNNVEFDITVTASEKLPIRELRPEFIGDVIDKLDGIIDLDINAGLYFQIDFEGKLNISKEFSFNGEAKFIQGNTDLIQGETGVTKEFELIGANSFFDDDDEFFAKTTIHPIKLETMIEIFGQGGCAGAGAFIEGKVDFISDNCSYISAGIDANINFSVKADEVEIFSFARSFKEEKELVGSKCEAPGVDWSKTYGGSQQDIAEDIIVTNDGGYLVIGQSESSDGDVPSNYGREDGWVVKLDASGDIVWSKNYGGSAQDILKSGKQTADGGYVLLGYTYSDDIDIPTNKGEKDFWVLKLDDSGGIIWSKTYGGSLIDNGYDIEVVPGGYVLAGNTASRDGDITDPPNNHNSNQKCIFKIDNSGQLLWQYSQGHKNNFDWVFGMCVRNGEECIIAGQGHGRALTDLDLNVSSITVNSFDRNWSKSFNGENSDNQKDTAKDIQNASDGGLIVGGEVNNCGFSDCHDGVDGWFLKLSASGDLEWQRALGGSNSDYIFSVLEWNGQYLFGGTTNSKDGNVSNSESSDFNGWVGSLSPGGFLNWDLSLEHEEGNTDVINRIIERNDGGLIAAGRSGKKGDAKHRDFWVVKLNKE